MPFQFEMIHLATTIEEVREAVDRAKDILEDCGINVDVTADQLWDWFETDLPVADNEELGEIITNSLLVIHELVEIDEVLKMGLTITKDVIVKNPDRVDTAHLKAAKVELMVAKAIGETDHIGEMCTAIEKWCVDKTVSEANKVEYRKLLSEAKSCLAGLAR
jgi:hypothetical protein